MQPTQYSCLENRIDRGAWWATVQGAAESDTTGAELDEEDPAECQLECPQLRGGFRAPITAFNDERGGEGGPGWVVTQL